ncbi:alpha/beta hydrolase [Robbsia sp. Bb-Pol-6]|uniref:Alpha/beta hydrolase n=1 Tax=Robbsia betulipollinis TaxID=2981849 RepID=A0ABT3ZHF4_9BURK|nr:alpha/beta hydrolase [Robbsia betulipollinis]MCY0385852.1 alpha/beta hydrolase [Robbsia betulipollinis]
MHTPSFPTHPQIADLDGAGHIGFVEAGAGPQPPLLLVHGSLCDYRYWHPQIAALAARGRVVVVSLPFYFPVARQPAATRFSVDAHADALHALIVARGWTGATLVGHSRGGSVCFQFANRYPEALGALVLADPGGQIVDHRLDGSGLDAAAGAPSAAGAVSPDGRGAMYDSADPRMVATRLIEQGQVEAGLELFVDTVSRPGFWRRSGAAFQAMARDNAHTLSAQMRDALPTYTRDAAQRIAVPTLLLNGEKSPAVFLSAGTALERWIPDVRRVTMKGASHGMNLSHAAEFNSLVQGFVDRLPTSTTHG